MSFSVFSIGRCTADADVLVAARTQRGVNIRRGKGRRIRDLLIVLSGLDDIGAGIESIFGDRPSGRRPTQRET